MNDEAIKQATAKVITEMLTESTGRALMDSGNAYGRHWERNQRDGIMTGHQICDFYRNDEDQTCELIPTIPIFDVFSNALRYTEECKYLESLMPPLISNDGLSWIQEEIKKDKTFKENEYMGTSIFNSYNREHFMSQDYESIYFKYDDEPYVAISIHNGCDIRGGYTNVHIFDVGYEDEFLNAQSDIEIDCLHTDGKTHICESGYQMYGVGVYYSYREQDDVDEKYVYQNTYVDENNQLRCKECDGLIVCSSLQC